ncbi:MAG: hypothetical protein CENE_00065 [Candidatus Celerinatantimonas neptuna]|nr:MAG: hypothetical protein CENE_00065 [Candidatus Celerinatantimonas neptuna]
MSETRSKQLFSDRQPTIETSKLSNSKAYKNSTPQPASMIKNGRVHLWYRLLPRLWWAQMGISTIESHYLLARIAAKDDPRTSDLLDTVEDYRPGNWCFEWLRFAVGCQTKSPGMMPAMAANIASYPHLKGDHLSDRAQTLSISYYQQAISVESSVDSFERIESTWQSKKISGFLHTPPASSQVPLVIAICDVSMLFSEMYIFYRRYLASNGIAMLSIDFAGCGELRQHVWSENSSDIYQPILDKVIQNPRIDTNRIALLGVRFGAQSAIRLAQLNPQLISTVAVISPAVSDIFTDENRLPQLPQMVRDCLANRLNIDAADHQSLKLRLHSFSLKQQGLLRVGGGVEHFLCVTHRKTLLCSSDDLKLLCHSAKKADSYVFKGEDLFDILPKSFEKCGYWLQKQLSCG